MQRFGVILWRSHPHVAFLIGCGKTSKPSRERPANYQKQQQRKRADDSRQISPLFGRHFDVPDVH
jgi:hypothetical protein